MRSDHETLTIWDHQNTALSTEQRAWSGPQLGACVVLSHLLLVIIKKQLDLGCKI